MNRRAAQPRRSTDQLMTWASARLPRWAHVTLAVLVACVLAVAGILLGDAVITDDGGALLFAGLWTFNTAVGAGAYLEWVRR